MKRPAITVLMPVYNAGLYLRQALDSLWREKGPPFEVLALDDGSTDQSYAILKGVRDSRLRVLKNSRNLGIVVTLNRGLKAARAPLVARLDADDLNVTGRLAVQWEAFEADPRLLLCATNATVIDGAGAVQGRGRWVFPPEGLYAQLQLRNTLCHSSVMYRRQAVLGLGAYERGFAPAEDFELWGRMAKAGPIRVLAPAWVCWRQHGGQVSAVQAKVQSRRALAITARRLTELGLETPSLGALEALVFPEHLSEALPRDLLASAGAWLGFAVAAYRRRPAWTDEAVLRAWLWEEHAKRQVRYLRRGLTLGSLGLPSPSFAAPLRGWTRGFLGSMPYGARVATGLLGESHFP